MIRFVAIQVRILKLIKTFYSREGASIEVLLAEFGNYSNKTMFTVLKQLCLKYEYLTKVQTRSGPVFKLTEEGDFFLTESNDSPSLPISPAAFKKEALTGSKEKMGKCGLTLVPSDIVNPVLLKSTKSYKSTADFSPLTARKNKLIEIIAKSFSITVDQLAGAISVGTIQQCTSCDEFKIASENFHKDKQKSTGYCCVCKTCKQQ
ncbi:MAG: hypothetical protein DRQ49_19655, partial [Gammaproteobacteria bacterium]